MPLLLKYPMRVLVEVLEWAYKDEDVFCFLQHKAEGEGFEPSIPCGIQSFQDCALDHYATPPSLVIVR